MWIRELHNALDLEECKLIIAHATEMLAPLQVTGAGNRLRIGDGVWLKKPILTPEGANLSSKVRALVRDCTQMPLENQEAIHVVRYRSGGEYKEHYDFFHQGLEYAKLTSRGGQRSHSVLFYLNDGFEGGATQFVKRGVTVQPETGKMLAWANLHEDLTPNFDSKHAGLPVLSGEKWIAVVWVRQERFALF